MMPPSRPRATLRVAHAVAIIPVPRVFSPRANSANCRVRRVRRRACPAVLIPGDSILETTAVGGTATFFNIYQNVIVARILLSWFPGLQGNALVRPLITVCDPYLNLFRNVVPSAFGLDLSPVLALFLLQALGSATAALGAEKPVGQVRSRARRAQLPVFPWTRR